MHFRRIRYMRWAKERLEVHPARYNLATSGMEAVTPRDLGLAAEVGTLSVAGNNAFGHPGVRLALAKQYQVGPERVLVTQGTSLGNFLVLAALTEPGQLVMCEWPVYEPLAAQLESLGVELRWVHRRADKGYQLDIEAIRRGFAKGARLLVLTDLHNPTATLLDRDDLREIAGIAAFYEGWVVVDEVYLSGVFDQEVESAVHLGERCVITASLTKTYGMGPLRAGWAIGPAPVVERALEINDHLGVNAPYVAEEVFRRALRRLPGLHERSRTRREECLPLVRAFAEEHGLGWTEPAGGFFAWLRLPEGLQARQVEAHLRGHYDTQVTPGDFFGSPHHLRLGFGEPPEMVTEGLGRLQLTLGDLQQTL